MEKNTPKIQTLDIPTIENQTQLCPSSQGKKTKANQRVLFTGWKNQYGCIITHRSQSHSPWGMCSGVLPQGDSHRRNASDPSGVWPQTSPSSFTHDGDTCSKLWLPTHSCALKPEQPTLKCTTQHLFTLVLPENTGKGAAAPGRCAYVSIIFGCGRCGEFQRQQLAGVQGCHSEQPWPVWHLLKVHKLYSLRGFQLMGAFPHSIF
jgi:hypothetical protein